MEEEYSKGEAEMKALMKKENFNNRLIKNIISNEKVTRLFLKFLKEDADDEIKESRIHDKDSHYEAVELYKCLFQ